MTADFALSLFFEGIRLHRRTPEGWDLVGEVPLDSPDLARDLHALRQAGEVAGTSWQGTRLLLPHQQVRTLVLDGEQGSPEVLTALEGMTPYPVADLVVDFAFAEGRTHVAAVARETLDEAEAFAAEHGFRPVAFAAVLPDLPREAEFGPTRLAAMPAAQPEPVVAPAAIDPAPPVAEEAALPEAAPAEVAPVALPDEAPLSETVTLAPEPPTVGPAAPLAVSAGPGAGPAPRALKGERRPIGAADPSPRRSEGQRVEPSVRSTKPPAGQARVLAAAPVGSRPDPRMPPRPAAARPEPAVMAPAPAATVPDSLRAAPTARAPRPEDAEPPAAALSDRRDKLRVGGKPRYLGLILTAVLILVMAAVAVLAASSERGLAGLFQRATAVEVAAAPSAQATPDPAQVAAPRPEDAQAGALPAEETPAEAAPAAAVLVASAAPEAPAAPSPAAAEAAAGAVAAALAALPRATEAPEAPEPAPADAVAEAEPPAEAAPPADPAATLAEASPPTADAALTPEEADRHYAATGVWLRAPRLPLQPEPTEAAPSPSLPTLSPGKALLPPPVLAALAPDAGPQTEASPAVPAAPAPEAPLAAAGSPVVTGPPSLVPPTRPGAPAPEASGWLNAMAEPPSRFPPPRPTAPEGSDATLIAQAKGPPASEATAPAEAWVNAMAEPPSRFPPQRPEAPAGFAPETPALAFAAETPPSPGAIGLEGLRPATRPADLSPPPGYEPPPVILASFDGPRPGPRPEGIAPEAALPEAPDVSGALAEALATPEPPAEPDLQSTLAAIVEGAPDPLAGATRQAVAMARVPDARPRNFDRVVQQQLDRLNRASQQAAAPRTAGISTRALTPQEEAEIASEAEVASSAAAAPSGPTATSVAAAATRADAIALRDINLIGVYGQPGARRALVRLGNGRYLRVGVGDQLDGGQVTAIGDNALNYQKRGRTLQLVIPGG